MKRRVQLVFLMLILLVASCAPEEQPVPEEPRDKIIGTYSCNELENGINESTFDILIRKDSASKVGLLIDNFYNIGFQNTTKARLISNTISIDPQNVSNFKLEGEGNFNGTNKISFTYKATVGGTLNKCTATGTKQ